MRFDDKKDISPKYLLLFLTIVCVVLLIISYFAKDKVKAIKVVTEKIVAPIQCGINTIGEWTDSKMDNLNEIESLNEENRVLTEKLDKCKEEITRYQAQLLELEELRALYNLDESYPDYEKTAAHVFATDSTSWFSMFYIDKGTDDGLFEGANVMCHDGLAGIIVECSDSYSKVRAIIDDNSNISAKIMPSNALCTVEGNLTQYQNGYIVAKNIDKDASVKLGDKLITSHISERFLPGIALGYVSDISLDSNNLTMTAYITPYVDFKNISNVLVILKEKETINKE